MHRRSLPIAEPCRAFAPTADRSWCPNCERQVHDLSEMTASQLRHFLTRHDGRRVCVAYRTRRDGTLVLRPEPRPIGTLLVALGLVACTGHAPELEHPDSACRDAAGYEIECNSAREDDLLVIPEGESDPRSDAATRPSAGGPTIGGEHVRAVPRMEPRGTDELRTVANEGRSVGAVRVVVHRTVHDAGGFVPTFQLIEEFRERRAERHDAATSRRARRVRPHR